MSNQKKLIDDGFDEWMKTQDHLVTPTLRMFPKHTHNLIVIMLRTAYMAGANTALETINAMLPDHQNETDVAVPSTPDSQQ